MIKQLEIFRFLAFVFIFCHHAPTLSGCDTNVLGRYACASVSFFFCVSGFLSAYRHVALGKPTVLSFRSEWTYVFGKILRFYPFVLLHFIYACIIRNGFIFNSFCACDWDKFGSELVLCLKVLTLTISWFPADSASFGLQWFFSTILFLYIMQKPLLYLLDRICQSSVLTFVLFCGFPLLLMSVVSFWVYSPQGDNALWLYAFPPSRLAEYVAGMSIGALCARKAVSFESNVRTVFYSVLEICLLTFWLVFPSVLFLWKGWDGLAIRWAVSNLMLIYVFGFGRGLLSRLFSQKCIVMLGAFAMPCFWLHPLIISVCTQFVPAFRRAGYFSCAVALVLTMVIAAFFIGDKDRKWNIPYPVLVSWGALLALLVIPGGVTLTLEYVNSNPVSVVLDKGAGISRYGVYYMTESDPSFSERKHLKCYKPIELEDGRMQLAFRLNQSTKFQLVITPAGEYSVRDCFVGSRQVVSNDISVVQNKKHGFTTITVKVPR